MPSRRRVLRSAGGFLVAPGGCVSTLREPTGSDARSTVPPTTATTDAATTDSVETATVETDSTTTRRYLTETAPWNRLIIEAACEMPSS